MVINSSRHFMVSWDAFDNSIYSEDIKETPLAYSCFVGTTVVPTNIHIIASTSDLDEPFQMTDLEESSHNKKTLDVIISNSDEKEAPVFFRVQPDSEGSNNSPHTDEIMSSKRKKRGRTPSNPRLEDNFSFAETTSRETFCNEDDNAVVRTDSDPHVAVLEEGDLLNFQNLADVIKLNILGYLNFKDVRSAQQACKSIDSVLKTREAHWLWKDLMNFMWPWLNIGYSHNISDGCATNVTNYSAILAQCSENQPTDIHPLFAERIVARKVWNHRLNTFRSILREPEFRTYSMSPTIKNYDKSTEHFQDVTVWQFKGAAGQGNRCIHSDKPFPRPPVQTSSHSQQSSSEKFDPNSSLLSFSSGYPNMSFLDILKQKTKKVKTPTNLETMLPFVSPFWSKRSPPISSSHDDKSMSCLELNLAPRLIAYFEVSILPRDTSREDTLSNMGFPRLIGHHDNANRIENGDARYQRQNRDMSECIAIGISNEHFNRETKEMPGWDKCSYAYHSDDGGIFHGKGEMQYGPNFGIGDTIGCGINYKNGGIFFTLNGKFLGYAWTELPTILNNEHEWYPTVGVDSSSPLAFNYGIDRPFFFNLAEYVACGGKNIFNQ